MAAVRPYQARALTTPARPAAATTPAAGSRGSTTPSSEYSTKQTIAQPNAPPGGSRRHQVTVTPPWLSGTVMASRTGTAARNGQENGSTATPNTSVTIGT